MEKEQYYLLIDTSTEVCSVALTTGIETIAQEIEYEGGRHSSLIGPFAEKVLERLPHGACLTAVGVAEGPGSYTGLRIAASFAKAICMTQNIPLVAVPTPELLVRTFIEKNAEPANGAVLVPMIDARRMEIYTGLYDKEVNPLTKIDALILTDDMARSEVWGDQASEASTLYYFGDGASKALEVMSEAYPGSVQVHDLDPEACYLRESVVSRLRAGQVCDVAYWTPFYLKEYEAKISVNKVLGNVRTK